MDLVVSAVEHEDFYPSAMAFVTRLATVLDCDRVSLGFVKGNHVKVNLLSHSADFGKQTNLARAIGFGHGRGRGPAGRGQLSPPWRRGTRLFKVARRVGSPVRFGVAS